MPAVRLPSGRKKVRDREEPGWVGDHSLAADRRRPTALCAEVSDESPRAVNDGPLLRRLRTLAEQTELAYSRRDGICQQAIAELVVMTAIVLVHRGGFAIEQGGRIDEVLALPEPRRLMEEHGIA